MDSGLFSRSQQSSVTPFSFLPPNDPAILETRLPFFPNGASEALVADRSAYHHNVHCSLDSSDTRVSWPSRFFELSQSRNAMRAASV
ncbi:unnamed protein product [Penicillium roqueforti FM164]|jgi:hypothetical protein|uniref:Genomic scaffold, ProqFM164S03 n=1 Tax=Penicillium roqueforti (strain FM164) TaxID=1365484 RepID=W6QB86_PENRF|nr:unnamed protein product [Penicillium roqueforti FM164]